MITTLIIHRLVSLPTCIVYTHFCCHVRADSQTAPQMSKIDTQLSSGLMEQAHGKRNYYHVFEQMKRTRPEATRQSQNHTANDHEHSIFNDT